MSDNGRILDSIKEQASIITEILNHAGKLSNNFDTLNNYLDSLDTESKKLKKLSLKSISKDLYDLGMEYYTNQIFNEEKLLSTIKASNEPTINVSPNDFELTNLKISYIDKDIFVDLMSNLIEDKEYFSRFKSIRNESLTELNNFVASCEEYENKMVEQRNNALEFVKNNIKYLVAMHEKFAWNKYHKKKSIDNITLCNKVLEFKMSQKEYISSSLQKILNIQ